MGHLEAMQTKFATLRELGAVAELDRRWDDYGEEYDYEMLMLRDPVALAGEYPGGLADLYRESDRPVFGEIRFLQEPSFSQMPAVDAEGNPIDDRTRIKIASIGEDAVLLDVDSGSVMIYWYSYFKYQWESGVILECADVPEFVATVCLGARFAEIKGPKAKQKDQWWDRHPWYSYLQEIGMA